MMPAIYAPLVALAARVLGYTPFLQPLKVWDYWPWLLLPLCFAVSIVYKAVRVESVVRVPLEALKATVWIVAGMAGAGAALWLLVYLVSR